MATTTDRHVPVLRLALIVSLAALVLPAAALAHSSISPPVAQAKTLQQFTLELQAEKPNAKTVRVEIDVPDGFGIETFPASPGWKRQVTEVGSGEDAHAIRVIWTGGEPSARDDPVFRFTGTLAEASTYGVKVRQVYSDNSVVDWAGPEDSEQPAAYIRGVSSIGGDGAGSSTLDVIALVGAGLAVLLALFALLGRNGRPLA
jgi:uncharacterized protein YcnI